MTNANQSLFRVSIRSAETGKWTQAYKGADKVAAISAARNSQKNGLDLIELRLGSNPVMFWTRRQNGNWHENITNRAQEIVPIPV